MMTLSAALATGRPFKHKEHSVFIDPTYSGTMTFFARWINEPVWQVQEEEKPPMRVWARDGGEYLFIGATHPKESAYEWTDCTESLAKALAPYIKKELKL